MRRILLATATLLAFLLPGIAPASADPPGSDRVTERGYDAQGRLAWERGLRTDVEGLAFERVYHHRDDKAKGGLGSATSAATDCPSTKYTTAGWRWTGPYSGYADQHATLFTQAGNTWDVETGADIFGSFQSGLQGTAGVLDGINQIQFANLGASTTIAVTTTWYYRSTGQAVESDGQYNTYYPWSTSGEAGKMDVLNIAVHEVGHTFGLTHPKGTGIACLTMYAYADYGETQKRTLGDGDILGIEALYGA
ncbi:MAG TPA: matrixin family metalloprotease [Candidatus Thermoplasmatota archaeon]|nr:matrixin family metalloprotease [Candidatus Thermoplasmatota archaeon]